MEQMKNPFQVNTTEVVFALLNYFVIQIIMGYNQSVVKTAATASWLMLLYLAALSIVAFLLLSFLMQHFKKKDILDICTDTFGRVVGTIYGLTLVAGFVFQSASVLRQVCDRFKIIAYENSPLWYILLFFVLAAVFACFGGLDVIIRAAKIIMPFVLFSLVVLLVGNFEWVELHNLQPFWGNGVKSVFWDSLPLLSLFSPILSLLLLPPYLKDHGKVTKSGVWILVTGGILYSMLTVLLLMKFPYPTSQELLMPYYVLSGLVTFGDRIARVEVLFLLTWVLGIMLYFSLLLMLGVHTLQKSFGLKNRKVVAVLLGALVFALAFFPQTTGSIKYIEQNILAKYGTIPLLVLPLIILIAANVKRKIKESL